MSRTTTPPIPARTIMTCDGCGLLQDKRVLANHRGWFELKTIITPTDALNTPYEEYDLCSTCIASALGLVRVERVSR